MENDAFLCLQLLTWGSYMNRVQNPVDFIRTSCALARSSKRASHICAMRGQTLAARELEEIHRFHVLAAWTTRQFYRNNH